ncbi:LANO_0D00782g1_1 [Lachancea nothofagi CBS 11611]|uniref:LANO_0D00782g1_1 n=1 Tax=Lachancea nothofagi CBS 11611 TaxID=1266666 RepID=A0A1G4JDK4_9SACH|nr:LANO_0D00782g1_1 [Lachancea nothofagi CBS 11611]
MTEGASLQEQLLDAARRNNIDLLETIFEELGSDETKIAELINSSCDPMGNSSIHLCCQYGSWEVLDRILDQEGGIEIDSRNKIDGDTPLHAAVRYALTEPEHGIFIAQNLVEVGADPRLLNKAGQKPLDLVHGPELDSLIDLLQGAELAAENQGVVNEEDAELIDDGPED